MSQFSDIAPRLARAHAAEKRYQKRRRSEAALGYTSFEVALEELARSFRRLPRHRSWATPVARSGYQRRS